MTMTPENDPIVARATPPGAGAVGIVRIDGVGTARVIARLFVPVGAHAPVDRPRRMVFGRFIDPATGETIDHGLCVFFRGPASFTGNDLAEFHAHGGAAPMQRLLTAAGAVGARQAEPGEFTRRAFLNGRLDLAQAEAVADLINAQTEAAARAAASQLEGRLSERVAAARAMIIELGAEIEARIDFPEEEIEPVARERIGGVFLSARTILDELLATRRHGRLVREGARVALVGRPNAGKSSLLNALARVERAIVTPHPGTTRDTVECMLDIQGIPVTLVDTAGIRPSEDPVERLGIERSRREIERADLVILVVDGSEAGADVISLRLTDEDLGVEAKTTDAETVREADLLAINKADLLTGDRTPPVAREGVLYISALRGDGLKQLEEALVRMLTGGQGPGEGGVAINARHSELLEGARAALNNAWAAFDGEISGELVMIDLRESLDGLGAVLGIETGDAILDRIFSSFCIGK